MQDDRGMEVALASSAPAQVTEFQTRFLFPFFNRGSAAQAAEILIGDTFDLTKGPAWWRAKPHQLRRQRSKR